MYANFKGHYDILSPLAAKMNPDLTPCHMYFHLGMDKGGRMDASIHGSKAAGWEKRA